jgi:hypothetical protein
VVDAVGSPSEETAVRQAPVSQRAHDVIRRRRRVIAIGLDGIDVVVLGEGESSGARRLEGDGSVVTNLNTAEWRKAHVSGLHVT